MLNSLLVPWCLCGWLWFRSETIRVYLQPNLVFAQPAAES